MKKLALINSLILLKIFVLKNQRKNNTLYCNETNNSFNSINNNNIKYLLKFNREKFEEKRCPKILYLNTQKNFQGNFSSNSSENLEALNQLKNSFEKVHEKYPEMESYSINMLNNFSNFETLENLLNDYGTTLEKVFQINSEKNSDFGSDLSSYKESIKNKPFLLFNKYGDIKAYSEQEFSNIAEGEMIYNYFEKFSILNNKTDILFMNEHDNIFLIFLDGKKVDYMHPNFKIFRKIFFNLNFFNLKFFVCTEENKKLFNFEENEKIMNNIYLLKRKNILSDLISNNSNGNIGKDLKNIEIEGEDFSMINLTEDLLEINEKGNDKEKIGKEGENNF